MVCRYSTATAARPGAVGEMLNVQLQGELAGFTLAVQPQLGTASLLRCHCGKARMLSEERFEVDELALLACLLRAYPCPIADMASDLAALAAARPCAESLRQKLVPLSCELAFSGGLLLRPHNGLGLSQSLGADELLHFALDAPAPAGATLVANQRLCTLALLLAEPGDRARLVSENQLSAQQMAILLTMLDSPPAFLSEVYGEYAQAEILYGSRWSERDERLDRSLGRRFPNLPREEQACLEQAVWGEIEAMLPLLSQLGLAVRRETCYLIS